MTAGFYAKEILNFPLVKAMRVGTTIGDWVFALWSWGCPYGWILVSLFLIQVNRVAQPNFTSRVVQGFKVLLPFTSLGFMMFDL